MPALALAVGEDQGTPVIAAAKGLLAVGRLFAASAPLVIADAKDGSTPPKAMGLPKAMVAKAAVTKAVPVTAAPPKGRWRQLQVRSGPAQIFQPPVNLWHMPDYVSKVASSKPLGKCGVIGKFGKRALDMLGKNTTPAKFTWTDPDTDAKYFSGNPGTFKNTAMSFEAMVVGGEVHASWTSKHHMRWTAAGQRSKGCGVVRQIKATTVVTTNIYDISAVRATPEFYQFVNGPHLRHAHPPAAPAAMMAAMHPAAMVAPPIDCGADGDDEDDNDSDYSDSSDASSESVRTTLYRTEEDETTASVLLARQQAKKKRKSRIVAKPKEKGAGLGGNKDKGPDADDGGGGASASAAEIAVSVSA